MVDRSSRLVARLVTRVFLGQVKSALDDGPRVEPVGYPLLRALAIPEQQTDFEARLAHFAKRFAKAAWEGSA